MTGGRELRPHQVLAMDLLRQSIGSGKRCPVLQAPTGAGKTRIAAEIVHGARAKSKRIAFGVPALSLIDQTFSRFVTDGIDAADMGVIQSDHPWKRPAAPIQICSAQTLARRDLPDVDIVVIDECHLRFAIYDKWMTESGYGPKPMPEEERAKIERQRRPIFLGLSATPWAKGMGQWFDDLLKPTSIAELIEKGFLSPFKVYAPSHPDLSGIKTVAGDYHEGQLSKRMQQKELVADIVSTWLMRGGNQPTLCFCVDRAHARAVAEQFDKAGVPTAYVDANTSREEREEIGKRLAFGNVKVIVNIGTMTTGVDLDVRCLILARPTKSESLFVQIIGRALRTAPGKEFATILDHSDTTLRLGMVTDIDRDELDDGKPKKRSSQSGDKEDNVPLPKECPECSGLIPAVAKECPCCGAVVKRPHNVETADGELVELTPGSHKKPKRIPVGDMLRALPPHDVYAEMNGLREEMGKSRGWLLANYRELMGKWPPRGIDETLVAEPRYELRGWIRAKQIAWAKGRAKGRRQDDRGEVAV